MWKISHVPFTLGLFFLINISSSPLHFYWSAHLACPFSTSFVPHFWWPALFSHPHPWSFAPLFLFLNHPKTRVLLLCSFTRVIKMLSEKNHETLQTGFTQMHGFQLSLNRNRDLCCASWCPCQIFIFPAALSRLSYYYIMRQRTPGRLSGPSSQTTQIHILPTTTLCP